MASSLCAMSTNEQASAGRLYPAVAQSAACIILSRRRPGEEHNEYALVQRGNPPNAFQWSFPGGRVELGRTVLETAQSELEEETGIMRDRVLWGTNAVGLVDVIVDDDRGSEVDAVEGSQRGEMRKSADVTNLATKPKKPLLECEPSPNRTKYHYTVNQIYGKLIGDVSEEGSRLVAGDDALGAVWWCPDRKDQDISPISSNAKTAIARIEALSSAGLLECVSAALPSPPTNSDDGGIAKLTEVKRKIDGRVQKFSLECWEWNPREEIVVGLWTAPPGGEYGMPEGSFSWGVWGHGVFGDANVGAYRIHMPNGSLKAYRFDVLRGVEMSEDPSSGKVLAFHDLLLDVTVTTGATDFETVFEDEDEIKDFAKRGELSESQLSIINETKAYFSDPSPCAGASRLVAMVDGAIANAIGNVRDNQAGRKECLT